MSNYLIKINVSVQKAYMFSTLEEFRNLIDKEILHEGISIIGNEIKETKINFNKLIEIFNFGFLYVLEKDTVDLIHLIDNSHYSMDDIYHNQDSRVGELIRRDRLRGIDEKPYITMEQALKYINTQILDNEYSKIFEKQLILCLNRGWIKQAILRIACFLFS